MAEINFNNLYNQLSPMDKMFYDQQFQKSYNPNKENLRLSGQENYDQMKAVYDAQQQVPEKGFFDFFNFGEASAAEKPQVPDLTYRNITPTFDLATGITNTTAASPFKIGISDQLMKFDPNIQNKNTVDQIIAENQMKASQNFIGSPFLNVPRGTETISPNTGIPGVVEPDGSFRVIPGYINRSNNIYMGDAASAKPNKIDLSSLPANMGVANEPDEEQVDSLTGEKEESGIMKLIKFLIPGSNLGQFLPKSDPRATGIRNFYSPEGLTSTGSIASGIMKGYNPVSGGFLNMITGGKFGKPTNYGLARAMQKRIENILGRKAAQTDASRAKVAELRNLQRQEIQDRADRGESLSDIGKSTFSGKGMAFEKRQGTTTGKGTANERNYGGR